MSSTLRVIFGLFLLIAIADCSSLFKITLGIKNMPSMDIGSGLPDPYVKISKAEGNTGLYAIVGQTPILHNNGNPTWKEEFSFKFIPAANQRLRFEIWDEDIGKDDYMGRADVTFAKIVNSKNETIDADITGCPKTNCGRFQIRRVAQ